MVSKDQGIGGVILAVCAIVGILYTLGLFWFGNPFAAGSAWNLPFTLIAIPVYIAFIAIMGIGAWIGWTMATTPPPKPIEEITSEMEAEQKKPQEEMKAETEVKEETAPPPMPASEPTSESQAEDEKKSERRRRSKTNGSP